MPLTERKIKFELSKNYNDSELFTLFGKYARHIFGRYFITFNDKDFSADNPSDLFDKVKKGYHNYVSGSK